MSILVLVYVHSKISFSMNQHTDLFPHGLGNGQWLSFLLEPKVAVLTHHLLRAALATC